jgi:hypothetical protein
MRGMGKILGKLPLIIKELRIKYPFRNEMGHRFHPTSGSPLGDDFGFYWEKVPF